MTWNQDLRNEVAFQELHVLPACVSHPVAWPMRSPNLLPAQEWQPADAQPPFSGPAPRLLLHFPAPTLRSSWLGQLTLSGKSSLLAQQTGCELAHPHVADVAVPSGRGQCCRGALGWAMRAWVPPGERGSALHSIHPDLGS